MSAETGADRVVAESTIAVDARSFGPRGREEAAPGGEVLTFAADVSDEAAVGALILIATSPTATRLDFLKRPWLGSRVKNNTSCCIRT